MTSTAHAPKAAEAPSSQPPKTRTKPHAKQKDRRVKLFVHPPSIPTRFQTFVYDDGEAKAFGSSASRFDTKLHDLPGPGYYRIKLPDELYEGLSESKNGAAGFASKSKRFQARLTPAPTPATYHPSSPRYSHSLTTSPSPSFATPYVAPSPSSPAPGVPTWRSRFTHPTPGPGFYSPHLSQPGRGVRVWLAESEGAWGVFRSKTGRAPVEAPGACGGHVAPGGYEISEEVGRKTTKGAVAAFRSVPRKMVFTSPPRNPAPNQYDPQKAERLRDIPHGNPTRPPPSQPLHHVPPPPPHNPCAHDAPLPAPIAGYEPFPQHNPGPGSYELTAASEKVARGGGRGVRAVFVSGVKRFGGTSAGEGDGTLGPGFYRGATEVGARSFRLNLEGTWA
ncbi:uncharacterized protein EV422DRAFT_616078 [Fimicolochytrium jonesii]|uniref:uncharacterized protein n=1 Tax=Fimicolochytrium jonesii TaxID=1396493 RepID=UPI0022FF24A9|nr:uncharacterized protein EV422DRAFT_616078 [Fimicolochytrium jonesii]KAI8826626.1 hypothetical protein EV422DRAFT_616078 [Fimicolochytrium jonesii]